MSNARNLAKLTVDSNGDVAAASLDNVPPSDDASALTTGTLDIARIADASVTATKLASGAAASNLGNYVTTVNGSTGSVTVQSTLVSGTNIKTVNGTSLLGSGDITAGASTTYGDVGTYVIAMRRTRSLITPGQTVAASDLGYYSGSDKMMNMARRDYEGGNNFFALTALGSNQNAPPSLGLSGTWRALCYSGYQSSNTDAWYSMNLWVRIS